MDVLQGTFPFLDGASSIHRQVEMRTIGRDPVMFVLEHHLTGFGTLNLAEMSPAEPFCHALHLAPVSQTEPVC